MCDALKFPSRGPITFSCETSAVTYSWCHSVRSHRGAPVGGGARGIGEILVSEGVITSRQLEEAYRLGRQQRQGVGRTLLSLGYVGQSDLARALARRLRLDFMELNVDDVDPDVASRAARGGLVSRRYSISFCSARVVQ